MKKYLLVEGITDVAFVKYICFKHGITQNFDDFEKKINQYVYENLTIIDLSGQDKLITELSYLKDEEPKISKIGIIQDADKDFDTSKKSIDDAVEKSNIEISKIACFLTPNNQDVGDLEILLLSTLDKTAIPQLKCFHAYEDCLNKHIDTTTKAMDKAKVYSYTMFSKEGKDYHVPHKSFMYKSGKKYIDTKLWDLEKTEFQPIIKFILEIFQNN
jgi:hypothetical protein